MKVPSHYVIATFQLYGSLMLESPDYFFRVRERGRLRQTRLRDGHGENNELLCYCYDSIRGMLVVILWAKDSTMND